ncbi:SRPBCC family protein [Streptomyces bambusae]|uniref:Carbon monoxide dehydrogenase n=1 Tax=Streptomyces bambusae TaxID=1550616 RepID=A0ABS6Z6M5_9ACTN|nr:SRPBCC family protein [Streptomyces bambusae]MBW5483413.1 carbon monoxide dehydrogenase [Streptomyces bambusae]
MEHQVFVPVPVDNLRAVLRDPARLARCVPGLQRDADEGAGPLAGRLRLRVGGHTVTYRGALAVAEPSPDVFEVTGEGAEARGTGTVKLLLSVRLADADGGTRLEFTGTGSADGRAAAFDPEATATVVRRLLDRAAGHLASAAAAEPGGGTAAGAAAGEVDEEDLTGLGEDALDEVDLDEDLDVEGLHNAIVDRDDFEGEDFDADGIDTDGIGGEGIDGEGIDGEGIDGEGIDVDASDVDGSDADRLVGEGREGAEGAEGTEGASVFGTEVPPSSLDPFMEGDFGDFGAGPRPPAEAAHARRTMIGRSAEEVDHAPPRGRYAPVPAPDMSAPGVNLRWLAPAAALAIASAVVVGRVLRRRR